MFRSNLESHLTLSLLSLAVCGCLSTPLRTYQAQGKLETLKMAHSDRLQAKIDESGLTLQGSFQELQLEGKENFVEVKGRVDRLALEGENNHVQCAGSPTVVQLRGRGHRVIITEEPGAPRPRVLTEGSDHAVQFRPAKTARDAAATPELEEP